MSDNGWRDVQAALEDPRWDYRTVAGIARETDLDPAVVEHLLEMHRSEIRQGLSRGTRKIYTLKSRPKKVREVMAELQAFASNSL